MYLSAFNEDGNLLDWWFAYKLPALPNLKLDPDPNNPMGKDFWMDLTGHAPGADIEVETWIRGGARAIPPVEDSDGIHKTFGIKYIDFRPLRVPWDWPESSDHANWGITIDSDWVCVGDINRMRSVEKRGGGTLAFQDKELCPALSKADLRVAPLGHNRMEAGALTNAKHEPASTVKTSKHQMRRA
jgi:deoxyribonuclease II